MRQGILSLGASAIVAALTFSGGAAFGAAATNPTILIMSEDADADSVPRASRVSTRILDELVTQFHSEGYDVYDETAVTLDTHVQGRSRRTDAELVDVARAVRKPPIDVVVFFTVFASTTRKSYANELNLRIAGRLLSTQDGRRLGSWEDELSDRWVLPNRCFPADAQVPNRECILEAVGRDARKIAQGVGSILREKLDQQVGFRPGPSRPVASRPAEGMKRGFVLVFEGFDDPDVRDIEEYLVVFSGYVDHRRTSTVGKTHEFWYESTIENARLQRNLNKMLEVMTLDATLQFSGNTYTVRNKQMRKERPRQEIRRLYDW